MKLRTIRNLQNITMNLNISYVEGQLKSSILYSHNIHKK